MLNPNYIYHGECVSRPRHNQVSYQRTPKMFFILFEVENIETKSFLDYPNKSKEGERLGLEVSPILFQGNGQSDERQVHIILQKMEDGELESILGGQPEGLFIKNYSKNNKWPQLIKLVRETFKEEQGMKKDPSSRIQSAEDLCQMLGKQYDVLPRYHKAVQHLKESKKGLSNSMKDVGLLVKELDKDLLKEHQEDLAVALLGYFFPHIAKYSREGLTEWYSKELDRERIESKKK